MITCNDDALNLVEQKRRYVSPPRESPLCPLSPLPHHHHCSMVSETTWIYVSQVPSCHSPLPTHCHSISSIRVDPDWDCSKRKSMAKAKG